MQGRTFDGHILDMMELGVTQYRGIDEFKGNAKRTGSKPTMLFQGDQWDNDETFGKLRNLLIGQYSVMWLRMSRLGHFSLWLVALVHIKS